MQLIGIFTLCFFATLGGVPAALVINEYWFDDASGDDAEYIELFGPPGMALSGLSLIVVDGDTGGNTGSSNYRRVTVQVDFSNETIPGDGFFLLGIGTTPNVDLELPGSLQNGSQTIALVNTADIVYDAGDADELTQGSVDTITLNLTDAIATVDSGAGDHVYFGTPVLGPNPAGFAWDMAARFPNGTDTDSAGDWLPQDNFALNIELGDANDALSSPGALNVPEPSTTLLSALGILFLLRRRIPSGPGCLGLPAHPLPSPPATGPLPPPVPTVPPATRSSLPKLLPGSPPCRRPTGRDRSTASPPCPPAHACCPSGRPTA